MSDEISKAIEYLNSVRNAHFTECETKMHYVKTFTDTVSLSNGSTATLTISFKEAYTISFPDFHVVGQTDTCLHCDSNGKLCLFNKDSVLIKPNMLPQLVTDCFDRVTEILLFSPLSANYRREYMREFDSYWINVAKIENIYLKTDTSKIRFNKMESLYTNSICVISENKVSTEIVAREYLKIPYSEKDIFFPVYVIRLKDGASLPPIKEVFSKKETIDYILKNLSSSNKKSFTKLLNRVSNKFCIMFIMICPSEYDDIVFGFLFRLDSKRKKSIKNNQNCKVLPLYVHRLDKSYLNNRLANIVDLDKKKVLLLGCGSVGGFLANNLCQTGITSIDILDKDIYMPENACRHFLGYTGIEASSYKFKADLVKERLYDLYPYVDIDSLNYVDRSVESFIKCPDKLSNYDLIISAIGDPTINLEINRILYENRISVPLLCCFNEPYGIGGHVVIVNVSDGSCLQCLYTDDTHTDVVSFRGSFVKEGQNFLRNISGCGSSFVPYGCLDSQQTALLAARMAYNALSGKLCNNTFCSWLGNSDLLTESGYFVSERYKKFSPTPFISSDKFGNCNCSVCVRSR